MTCLSAKGRKGSQVSAALQLFRLPKPGVRACLGTRAEKVGAMGGGGAGRRHGSQGKSRLKGEETAYPNPVSRAWGLAQSVWCFSESSCILRGGIGRPAHAFV